MYVRARYECRTKCTASYFVAATTLLFDATIDCARADFCVRSTTPSGRRRPLSRDTKQPREAYTLPQTADRSGVCRASCVRSGTRVSRRPDARPRPSCLDRGPDGGTDEARSRLPSPGRAPPSRPLSRTLGSAPATGPVAGPWSGYKTASRGLHPTADRRPHPHPMSRDGAMIRIPSGLTQTPFRDFRAPWLLVRGIIGSSRRENFVNSPTQNAGRPNGRNAQRSTRCISTRCVVPLPVGIHLIDTKQPPRPRGRGRGLTTHRSPLSSHRSHLMPVRDMHARW